jgi:protein-disulfide isomerase
MDLEQTETQTQPKAAFTIIVHSWATPIVGGLMLVIGLLGGYFGRPLLNTQPLAITTPSQQGVALPTVAPANPSAQPVDPEEVMALVISQTRHFKGNPDAPVTIIEYSDYQ